MKLLYLYGPPAAGKLTVAKELAALTGFRLFHNHLSIDAVRPVFDFGTDPFWRLVHSIREGVLAEAAREGVDLIATGVYAHPKDRETFERRFQAVESNGGSVCLVQLTCDRAELEARVGTPERIAMGKLANVDDLRATFAEFDEFSPIPGRESLCLDTTLLPPEAAARQIVAHYSLSTVPTTD